MQVSRDLMAPLDLLFSGFPNHALCLFTKIIIAEYCSLKGMLAHDKGSGKRWGGTADERHPNCAVYRTAANFPNLYAISGVRLCTDQFGFASRSLCS